MRVVTLGNGKRIALAEYVRGVVVAKQNPRARFAHGLTGWWPVTGAEIVGEFVNGMHDRINQRGALVIREANPARIARQLRERVKHDCRWCGQPLGRYAEPYARFCGSDCLNAHRS